MNRRTNGRRSLVIVTVVALASLAGCSSGSDGDSSEGSSDSSAAASSESVEATPLVDDAADTDTGADTDSDAATDDSGDSSDSAGSAVCGGLSAAAVGEAAGAGSFDSADDISVDADTTCLFSNSTGTYGIVVTTEPASSYLAGELDGASIDDALASLESVFSFALDEPTVTRKSVDGNDALIVSGTSMTGGAGAKIGTVVDGNVIIVEADGSDLATDPAGFESIVSNVLALATST